MGWPGTSFTTYFNEALALIAQGTADSPATGDISSPYTSPALAGGDTTALPTGPYIIGTDKGYWTQEAFYQASNEHQASILWLIHYQYCSIFTCKNV